MRDDSRSIITKAYRPTLLHPGHYRIGRNVASSRSHTSFNFVKTSRRMFPTSFAAKFGFCAYRIAVPPNGKKPSRDVVYLPKVLCRAELYPEIPSLGSFRHKGLVPANEELYTQITRRDS